ncbi:hypothetical protein R1flu_003521 [Riccia fluitans]|uniref:Uncharacterized protein n=1 Tax=Riccia fluitans TaxID=41844 RepID=A0ABD1Y994_9MARC
MEITMSMIQSTLPGLGRLIARRFTWDLLLGLPKYKYLDFMGLMHDFEAERINFGRMWEIASKILSEHPRLADRFKRFLPSYEEYNAYMNEAVEPDGDLFQQVRIFMQSYCLGVMSVNGYREGVKWVYRDHPEMADQYQFFVVLQAVQFAVMVKETFVGTNQLHRYEEFVGLMDQLNTGGGTFLDYRSRFEALFGRDHNLVEGFNSFLAAHEQIPLLSHGNREGGVPAGGGRAVNVDIGSHAAQGLPLVGDQIPLFHRSYDAIGKAENLSPAAQGSPFVGDQTPSNSSHRSYDATGKVENQSPVAQGSPVVGDQIPSNSSHRSNDTIGKAKHLSRASHGSPLVGDQTPSNSSHRSYDATGKAEDLSRAAQGSPLVRDQTPSNSFHRSYDILAYTKYLIRDTEELLSRLNIPVFKELEGRGAVGAPMDTGGASQKLPSGLSIPPLNHAYWDRKVQGPVGSAMNTRGTTQDLPSAGERMHALDSMQFFPYASAAQAAIWGADNTGDGAAQEAPWALDQRHFFNHAYEDGQVKGAVGNVMDTGAAQLQELPSNFSGDQILS